MHCGNLVVAEVRVSYIDLVVRKKKVEVSTCLADPLRTNKPQEHGGGWEEGDVISRVAIMVKINQFATNKLREMQRKQKKVSLTDR